MRSVRPSVLATILGLMGLISSWLGPMSGTARTVVPGDLPACCLRPSAVRCCSGDCCIARDSSPANPSTSLPALPGTSVRTAPDWVPAFLSWVTVRLGLPFHPSLPPPSHTCDRAPGLPLFLRDAALLI